MQTRKITHPLSLIFLLSAIASVGVHYYLTNQHIDLKYGIGEGSPICNISERLSCSTAIISQYSEFFGIPIAIFGMFLNMVIFFYGAKALIFKNNSTPKNASVTLTFAGISVAASLVMAFISLFLLKSLCPFCMMTYALSLILLGTSYLLMKPLVKTLTPQLGSQFLIAGLFVVFGSFAYSSILLKDFNSKEVKELFSLQISEWQNASPTPPDVIEPLKYGPDMAKMKIVEYADFLCPHCRVAYGKLHSFAKANNNVNGMVQGNGGVQIIFQPFPLDGCAGPAENPGLRCQLAMTAYCAEKQNKGWDAHEYIFHNQATIAENGSITATIEGLSTATGTNKEALTACIHEATTLEVIKKQMENGKKLGIEGTPTIYINDKKFRGAMHLPLLTEIYNKL